MAALLCLAPTAQATDVVGVVRTPDGQPVSQIVLRLESGGRVHETVTGAFGEFKIDLPDGSYKASARGFELDGPPVIVAGRSVTLDLALRPAKLREEILVSATRSRTASAAIGVASSVLDSEDLRARQQIRLTDALAELPGIAIGAAGGIGGQSSLFLRGGESRFARILIDGVPVNEPGGFFNFGTLLTPDVQRVEVVRGSVGTLYGSDALAGVVSFETAPGDAPRHVRGEATAGDLGTSLFAVTGVERRDRFSGSATFGRTTTDNAGPNADFTSNLFAASLERRAVSGASASASFRLNTSEGGAPGPTVFGRPDLDARYERDLMIATVSGRFRTKGVSHAVRSGFKRDDQLSRNPADSGSYLPRYGTLTASFASSDFPNPAGYANKTDRLFGTYELQTQVRRHTLTAGGDLERETGALGNRGETPLSPKRTSAGVFVQDQVAFTSRAFGTASLRVERNGSTGTTAIPRGSFAWVAADRGSASLTLRASGGSGIKAPSFFESYGTSTFALGNPNLRPERGRTFDGGVDLRSRTGRVEVTYFHHRYLDQIAYKVVSFVPFTATYENLGETKARGIEFVAEWRPSSHVRLHATWTKQKTEIVTSVSTDPELAAGKSLRRRPDTYGAVTAEGLFGRGSVAATLIHSGSRPDSDFLGIGILENEGFHRLDVRGAFDLSSRVRLLGTIENLTDADYQEVLGYRTLPRRFRVSLAFDSVK